MPVRRVSPAGLVKVGFQQLTLSNSTAQSLNSTMRAATTLFISVETQPCRFRADGTAPTKTTGVLIPTGLAPFKMEGYNGTSILKFQRSTGTSKVSVMGYR